jgi:hypothetical protein
VAAAAAAAMILPMLTIPTPPGDRAGADEA